MGKSRQHIPTTFRKAGDLGLLGISDPEQFGGMGLDYSYSIVAAEEFGTIRYGGIPMSIGVQTDMCTPALATSVPTNCATNSCARPSAANKWAASASRKPVRVPMCS